MIKFDILNRFSGNVQFTAEIDCDESALNSIKVGLAVKWAIKTGANLARANLAHANLADANLVDANLARANLADANLVDANLARANLVDANLADAYLVDANLARANLARANHISDRVIDGGLRSDGYRFMLTRTEPGAWRIKAGCRNFTVEDGAKHWAATRPSGEMLGDETRLIVANMVAMAKIRGWPKFGEDRKREAA